ncbi:primosomal protein N' [Thiospirochaeta perfilievii]|uniref:Replication restart protein PriA n=1 Tax=Thiospirochaeta perfilievii TaxID=252967 RepID=A0A5C1QBY3_9SPIO|nr:primosomal protein N' [Thiospirochaeta perfilievii]QEN05583.1 primosomal protein N' [Thiospirochaeta perfilievii]
MDNFLQVVFNIPVKATYTYKNLEDNPGKVGYRVEAMLGRRKLIGFVTKTTNVEPTEFKANPILRVVDKEPLFNSILLELANWVADFTMCSVGEALGAMLPGGKREKGLPASSIEEIPDPKDITLSTEQEVAITAILNDKNPIFYLFGITGSGKTEVFLQAAKEVLNRGESVIYLVPEISLTHQVVDTLKSRFTQGVAVLHSHLTPSQRLTEWRRIQSGEAPLIIGARSAIFAPCDKLGLIIIDEEHENSYKSSNTPRYSARQVAMKRARLQGSKLVLGSATPSVESWKLMDDGKIKRLNLTKRLSGGAMPKSTIVDMRHEDGVLSKTLIKKIEEAYNQGRQTILFLNRRGFSYFFHCNSCGYEMVCKNCSVSLTYHKNKNRMVCHYCGYQAYPISVCPECNSLDIGSTGFGVEHIEEEVGKIFPSLNIKRLDSDVLNQKNSKTLLKDTLNDFKNKKIDILLGTQMVARGLNFPGVKLVGIIMADTGLKMPDFRAAERSFGLIVQVSGRAGRYAPDGEVVIQTFMPQNRTINLAAKSDINSFYTSELEDRKLLEFPPYTRMIRLVFRSKRLGEMLKVIDSFEKELTRGIDNSTEILGPSECPISVIAGSYRHQILIRTTNLNSAHSVTYSLLQRSKIPAYIYIEVDVDPISLL